MKKKRQGDIIDTTKGHATKKWGKISVSKKMKRYRKECKAKAKENRLEKGTKGKA